MFGVQFHNSHNLLHISSLGYRNLLVVDNVDAAAVDGHGDLGAGLDGEHLDGLAGYGGDHYVGGLLKGALYVDCHILAVDEQTAVGHEFVERHQVTCITYVDGCGCS